MHGFFRVLTVLWTAGCICIAALLLLGLVGASQADPSPELREQQIADYLAMHEGATRAEALTYLDTVETTAIGCLAVSGFGPLFIVWIVGLLPLALLAYLFRPPHQVVVERRRRRQ